MKKTLSIKAVCLLIACGLPLVPQANAATVTWTATGGSSWTSTNNWTVPGANDVAQFGVNPSSASIKINLSGSMNNGTANEAVGAIEVSSLRTSGNVTVGAGDTTSGTLTLNGATDNLGVSNVVLHNDSSVNMTVEPSNGSTGVLTVALADSTNNIIQLDAGGNITVSANITQVGSGKQLTIAGAGSGTVSLSGSNSFSGGLVAAGGEVDVTSDSNLGAGGGSITINGGRLGFATNNTTIDPTRNIYLGANPTGGNNSGTLSIKGSAVTVTYNGVIQNLSGATGDLVKQGAGTLQLGGANTYSGNTFINNGIVQTTTSNNRLPTGTVLNVGQTASVNVGELDLDGNNQQIAGLNSTAGTNSSATAKNTITSSNGAATLTINTTGTYSYGNGTAANSGVITNGVSLVVQGTGSQALGDVNTYTGSTTVGGGTLIISGSLTATPSVSVSSGANLQVTGLINTSGSVTANGVLSGNGSVGAVTVSGTVSPGLSGAGTLTASSLSLNTGAHLAISINGTGAGQFTQMQSTNALSLGTGANLDLTVGYTPNYVLNNLAASDEITVALGSSISGSFANTTSLSSSPYYSSYADLSYVTASNGSEWAVVYGADDGVGTTNEVQLYAVPEPATWAMLLGGFGALILFQRMRKSNA